MEEKELEGKDASETPQGGGVLEAGSKRQETGRKESVGEERVKPAGRAESAAEKKKRRKRELEDAQRCRGRLPNGRRCEAAAMRHRIYCVFHDPEMQERRLRLGEPIPYEHPEDVQRLLGEAVKKKKLGPKQGNTVGYLATLLMQNQASVKEAKTLMERAQWYAELGAVMEGALADRWQRMADEAREQHGEDEEPE